MKPLARLSTLYPLLLLSSLGCATAPAKGPSLDEGKAVLRRIDLRGGSFDKLDLSVVVLVTNPTSQDVPVKAAAKVGVGGESIAGEGDGTAVAFKETEIAIPMTLKLPQDPAALDALLSETQIAFDVDGTVSAGGSALPFAGKREVAPPHLPVVSIKTAQVASVDQGASGAGFFEIAIDNKNPFEVKVEGFAWRIAIKGKELRALGEPESLTLPPSAVTGIEETVALTEQSFGKELKALLKQASVPYKVDGTLRVRGIDKPFHFEGDMQFAR